MTDEETIYHLKQELERARFRAQMLQYLLKSRVDEALFKPVNDAISASPTPAVNDELVERVSLELRNIIKRATYQPDEDIGQLRINCDKVVLFAECALKALSRAKGEGA